MAFRPVHPHWEPRYEGRVFHAILLNKAVGSDEQLGEPGGKVPAIGNTHSEICHRSSHNVQQQSDTLHGYARHQCANRSDGMKMQKQASRQATDMH